MDAVQECVYNQQILTSLPTDMLHDKVYVQGRSVDHEKYRYVAGGRHADDEPII